MPFFPVFPSSIIKGPVFSLIDLASRNRAGADFERLLRALRSRRSLVDLAKSFGIQLSEKQEAHIRYDWFNETGRGWWRHAQPIEPILRKGLIQTVELVRDLDLPIDAYWIRADDKKSAVRVTLTASAEQITFLFYSPRPQVRSGARLPKLVVDRSIWVVERNAKGRVHLGHVKSQPYTR